MCSANQAREPKMQTARYKGAKKPERRIKLGNWWMVGAVLSSLTTPRENVGGKYMARNIRCFFIVKSLVVLTSLISYFLPAEENLPIQSLPSRYCGG